MPIEIENKLKQITEEIFDDMLQVQKYAGTAYCTEVDDDSESKFWKGQYIALKRTRQSIERHMFMLQIEREKKDAR